VQAAHRGLQGSQDNGVARAFGKVPAPQVVVSPQEKLTGLKYNPGMHEVQAFIVPLAKHKGQLAWHGSHLPVVGSP
jgi:hypothetical protein